MQTLSPNLPPDTQREMPRRMLTIRRFEEHASADCLAGKIYGVVQCRMGEEAVAAGVCTALAQGDRRLGIRARHRPGALTRGIDAYRSSTRGCRNR